MRYGGWYQIAFERDLQADVSSVPVGDRRLLIVRSGGAINVYDATCPHRGADLGVGGKLLDPRLLTCPYHGHRIALGGEGGGPYCVAKYPSLVRSGLIFALVGGFEVGKLPDMLDYLERTHKIFAGFTATIKLRVGPSMWQGTRDGSHQDDGTTFVEVPLLARAYSPNLTITQVAVGGGDHPHFVIASAVPMLDGTSTIRLSVAMPRLVEGLDPPQEFADVMLQFESMGLEQDRPVWENLALNATPKYTAEDDNVLKYRKFCDRFTLNGRA